MDNPDRQQQVRRPVNLESIGGILVVGGVGIAILGGVLLLLSRVPIFNQFFGQLFHLPGDIHIETGSISCFVPIVSMIIISIVLTLLANIVIRLINRQ